MGLGFCYGKRGVGEAIFRELEEVSQLQALAQMGDLDHLLPTKRQHSRAQEVQVSSIP